MQILNSQEISHVSGGATTNEILDTGVVYGGTLGAVSGLAFGTMAGNFGCCSPGDLASTLGLSLASAFVGMFHGAVIGLVCSFPIAAFYAYDLANTKI